MVLILLQAGKRDFAVAIERGSYRGDDRLCRGRLSLSKAEAAALLSLQLGWDTMVFLSSSRVVLTLNS